MEKEYLTPNEVAALLMVAPVTVRQWAQKGDLPALTTPGGHRRFLRSEVEKFAHRKGLKSLAQKNEKLRILIVDDDQAISSFLVELFMEYSDTVRTQVANNGFEAGQQVEVFKPDIVLLDLMMPGLNGFQVCRQLKLNPLTEHIRVIAMTGYHVDDNVDRIVNAGAEVCLAKPLNVSKLFQVIGISEKQMEKQSL